MTSDVITKRSLEGEALVLFGVSGVGGMLPRKNLKIVMSRYAFRAFWEVLQSLNKGRSLLS